MAKTRSSKVSIPASAVSNMLPDGVRHERNKRYIQRLVADKEEGEVVAETEIGTWAMGYVGCSLVARDLLDNDGTVIDSEVVLVSRTGTSHTDETHLDGFKSLYDGEPLRYVKDLGNLPLVKGVVAIVGGHGAGKTPFLRDTLYAALEDSQSELIEWGEPIFPFGTRGAVLCEKVLSLVTGGNKTILIDSLKNVMDRTSGPLAKEGINRPFFTMLSDWSSTAMKMNCTIVVVVNLLSDTPAVIADSLGRLNSSTNMVILAEGNGQFSYKVRDHAAASRITGTFFSDGKRFTHNSRKGQSSFSDSEYTTRLKVVQTALLEQQMLNTITK